jgi:hypothetical protein
MKVDAREYIPLCSLPYTQKRVFVYSRLKFVNAGHVKVITCNVIFTKVPKYVFLFGS